jgi:hypothetical protein
MGFLSTFVSFFQEKHKYWSKQPVSRDHNEEGTTKSTRESRSR